MLEDRLAVGVYVYGCDFRAAMAGGPPEMANLGVIDAELTVRTERTERYGLFWAKKRVIGVEEVKVAFRWLPWVDGKINYCHAQGKDVLTGPFSGCWMASYREGDTRICHIALQTDDHDCKQAWRDKKATNAVSQVHEFCPHTSVSKGNTRMGLITSDGAKYAIGMEKIAHEVANPYDADEWMTHMKAFTGMDIDDATAREFAAKRKVSFKNFYSGEVFKIRDIKGPLADQAFPPA